jgi:hypothetical protein
VDCCVGGGRYFSYYSYCRNPTGKELFVPAGTLIAVKLLSHNFSIIKIHTSILFFLKCVRPDRVDRAGWPGTL